MKPLYLLHLACMVPHDALQVIASLIRRFADIVSCVALSSDARLLLAGCNSGRVMLWDTELRENIWEYSHHAGR